MGGVLSTELVAPPLPPRLPSVRVFELVALLVVEAVRLERLELLPDVVLCSLEVSLDPAESFLLLEEATVGAA